MCGSRLASFAVEEFARGDRGGQALEFLGDSIAPLGRQRLHHLALLMNRAGAEKRATSAPPSTARCKRCHQ